MGREKISVENLKKQLANAESNEFTYPVEYYLKFSVLQGCKYCKRIYRSKKVGIFEGKLISTCDKCGGRHVLEIKNLIDTKKSYVIIALSFFMLFCLIMLWLNG